jgi:LuxR family maltose regulon positive regulatory protein
LNEQNTGLVRAKLSAPTISHKIIKRAKVVKKLQQATDNKLTLITAPAGFGKTTTAVSYLAEAALPFAWLSLDENDNDPVRFWRYVLAALRGLGNFEKDFWEIPVRRELIHSNIQADMILDKLYTLPGKTVMVLDDYHLIQNEIVQNSLAYFIKYLPSHFKMVILSRTEPKLNVMREWTGAQVGKINIRDLSFDYGEVAAFFQAKGYQLTAAEIATVRDYTEGWAAGLVLTAFSMAEEGDPQATISRFSGKNRHVGQLFQAEVFDRWPDEIKNFMVRIAFLDKFCGPLCEAVTGRAASKELLNKLAERNSFIFHLDQENEWFRFHHLFSDFLRQRLEREQLTVRLELCRKAGEWYQQNGLMPEAFAMFIKAGTYEQAFPLILNLDLYLSMSQNGDDSDWLNLMDSIPPEYYQRDVRACTWYSWLLSMENRSREANLWADRAQSYFDRIKDGLAVEEKSFLEVHVLAAKASLAILNMDLEKVRDYFEQISHIKMPEQIMVGEMNSAEISILKTAYGFKGRLKKLDELAALLSGELPRIIGDFAAYLPVGMAESHYERNDLQTAFQILNQGMESVVTLGKPGAIVPCIIILVKLKRAEGDFEGAMRTIAMGRQKLAGKSKALWNYFLDLLIANLYIDRNDAPAAAEWLNIDRLGVFDSLSCSREYEHLTFARYLNLIGRHDEALTLLARMAQFAQKEDRLGSRIEILCQTAISHQLQSDMASAMTALDEALELGMADGYVRTFTDQLEPMAELLAKYKIWKKNPETNGKYSYVKNLLRLTRETIRTIRTKLPADQDVRMQPDLTAPQLSVKEHRVLRLLAAKRPNQEIAAELCISVRTVKYYNTQIFEKLGVANRTEAVARAWEIGILK